YFRGAQPGLIRTASGLAAEPIFRPILSQAVRQGVFAMAHRFIAGATPGEAVPALRRLADQGVGYTVDLLGEETLSDVEADAYLARYTNLLESLATADLPTLTSNHQPDPWLGVPPVNISVKLSALCSHLEPAAPAYVSRSVRERMRPLLRLARKHNAFINVDMEQYRHKDLVHTAFADLVLDGEFADYPHVGIVVQAYLRDALDDIDRLRDVAARRVAPFHVRLVKGAYWDEENIVAAQNSWPVPVWTDKRDTDHNFEACAESLLNAWPDIRSAFGTHNPRSVAHAMATARSLGLKGPDIEFQVLYGMAEDLRNAIAAEGYRTRVYLPVGQVIPGMAYLVRRLLENTSNQAWFNVATTAQGVEALASTHGAESSHGVVSPAAPAQTSVTQGPSPEATPAFTNSAPALFFLPNARVQMERALNSARARFGSPYPLLIGDRRVDDRDRADVTYPADPSIVVGRVAQGTPDDAEAAVAAAREAFPTWRDLAPEARREVLFRAADLMEKRRFDLAAVMVFESAKPWHEADGDVTEAIDYLRYYALQAQELATPRALHEFAAGGGLSHPRVPGEHAEYFHEGRGVTAVIAPWNFPLAIICGMTVASLAAGNCAILKPAAQSPIIAFNLVELLREAGVPQGVVQYLPGPGGRVGQALVEHPGIANIAFTGSKEVGLGIIESASRQSAAAPRPGGEPRLAPKRVVAEMGGKNAIIIDDDADLDQAVSGAIISAFGYAGQKCSACSRLIIVGHAYDEAVARLKNAVESLVVGPPDDPATFVPPVIGASARDKIMEYVAVGRAEATLLAQAPAPAGEGSYVPPTVFTDVGLDSRLAREEIFGPVLSVFRAATFEEALEMALNSEFALTGGVYSRNPRHIEAAKREFRVGNLYINRKITGAVAGRHPFGGLAMSGIGEKAGGPDYVRQFMDPRSVTENTTRRGFAPEEE
ncbi:MAG TPA: bifunctional proline dehydrogenase/L-glutamate gamma-semialdehyde dehydrogenase, partial [Dehalococcoidia bacterium]|nr:bifunctional proline dehydrogenase/L-glutamate gamma-semialdehyde dehydrogenase [Dehalococcoidia bacterium]